MQRTDNPTFAGLLRSAVEEPGTLSTAYQQFHNYSLGNQLLAMFQCHQRGIALGPLATFPRWRDLGRFVRKGEKALTLCMPITLKRRQDTNDAGTRRCRMQRTDNPVRRTGAGHAGLSAHNYSLGSCCDTFTRWDARPQGRESATLCKLKLARTMLFVLLLSRGSSTRDRGRRATRAQRSTVERPAGPPHIGCG